jgi:hypothetical protein
MVMMTSGGFGSGVVEDLGLLSVMSTVIIAVSTTTFGQFEHAPLWTRIALKS